MIDLITILDGCTIDLGRHAARVDEGGAIHRLAFTNALDLLRCLPGDSSFPAGNMEPEFSLHSFHTLFQGATDGRGNTT